MAITRLNKRTDVTQRPRRKERAERGWRYAAAGTMPAIDVYETDDRFVLKAELPGMKQDDIEISLLGDIITIRGEKQEPANIAESDYYFQENEYGNFCRSVSLPMTIDADKTGASYENGVLEITIPKSAEIQAQKVAIRAGKTTRKEK